MEGVGLDWKEIWSCLPSLKAGILRRGEKKQHAQYYLFCGFLIRALQLSRTTKKMD